MYIHFKLAVFQTKNAIFLQTVKFCCEHKKVIFDRICLKLLNMIEFVGGPNYFGFTASHYYAINISHVFKSFLLNFSFMILFGKKMKAFVN